MAEETGIAPGLVKPFASLDGIPAHIDAHPIPANPRKGEPEHRHFDFRFAWVGAPGEITLQAEEVRGWRWADVARVPEAVRKRLDLLAG
jgi:hypothetical protein